MLIVLIILGLRTVGNFCYIFKFMWRLGNIRVIVHNTGVVCSSVEASLSRGQPSLHRVDWGPHKRI